MNKTVLCVNGEIYKIIFSFDITDILSKYPEPAFFKMWIQHDLVIFNVYEYISSYRIRDKKLLFQQEPPTYPTESFENIILTEYENITISPNHKLLATLSGGHAYEQIEYKKEYHIKLFNSDGFCIHSSNIKNKYIGYKTERNEISFIDNQNLVSCMYSPQCEKTKIPTECV